KNELGTASFLDVVLVQRDVVTAQSSEVNALRNYSAARTNLDLVLGRTLDVNHVDIQEASTGTVKRPPAALPSADRKDGIAPNRDRKGAVVGRPPIPPFRVLPLRKNRSGTVAVRCVVTF